MLIVCRILSSIKNISVLFPFSLQMIKILKIENQEQYENLQKDFLILSLDSLKYISQKNSFKDIVKMANEI